MIRIIANVIGVILFFSLQVGFFPSLLPYSLAPNLLLAGIVLWIVLENDSLAFGWAIAGGLFLDLISPDLFGLQTILLLAVTGVLVLLRDRVMSTKSRFVHLSLMVVASVLILVLPILLRPVFRVFQEDVLVPDYSFALAGFLLLVLGLNILTVLILKPLFQRLVDVFLFIDQRRSRMKPFG